jgi:hypothetical protein
MPARTRKVQIDDLTRTRIRTTQLLNRLQDHADGKVELTNSQVKAVEILLRKSLPDLSAVQLTGSEGGPVEHSMKVAFIASNH